MRCCLSAVVVVQIAFQKQPVRPHSSLLRTLLKIIHLHVLDSANVQLGRRCLSYEGSRVDRLGSVV